MEEMPKPQGGSRRFRQKDIEVSSNPHFEER